MSNISHVRYTSSDVMSLHQCKFLSSLLTITIHKISKKLTYSNSVLQEAIPCYHHHSIQKNIRTISKHSDSPQYSVETKHNMFVWLQPASALTKLRSTVNRHKILPNTRNATIPQRSLLHIWHSALSSPLLTITQQETQAIADFIVFQCKKTCFALDCAAVRNPS